MRSPQHWLEKMTVDEQMLGMLLNQSANSHMPNKLGEIPHAQLHTFAGRCDYR